MHFVTVFDYLSFPVRILTLNETLAVWIDNWENPATPLKSFKQCPQSLCLSKERFVSRFAVKSSGVAYSFSGYCFLLFSSPPCDDSAAEENL